MQVLRFFYLSVYIYIYNFLLKNKLTGFTYVHFFHFFAHWLICEPEPIV